MDYISLQFILYNCYILVIVGFHIRGFRQVLFHEDHEGNTNKIVNLFFRVTIIFLLLINIPTCNTFIFADPYEMEYVYQMQVWLGQHSSICTIILFINAAMLTVHFLAFMLWAAFHSYLTVFKKDWNIVFNLLIIILPFIPAVAPICWICSLKRSQIPGTTNYTNYASQSGSYFNFFCLPMFQLSMVITVALQIAEMAVHLLRRRFSDCAWPILRIAFCGGFVVLHWAVLDITLTDDRDSMAKYAAFVCGYAVFLVPVLTEFGKASYIEAE
ncbi:unnamed protein product, partial [Mesorhabditis spiculigera]